MCERIFPGEDMAIKQCRVMLLARMYFSFVIIIIITLAFFAWNPMCNFTFYHLLQA